MSIKEMIREHPQASSYFTEEMADAVKHAMYCAAICNSCADACGAEEMDMVRCIRLCTDCADVCGTTSRILARQTETEPRMLRAILQACITACRLCAAECDQHGNDHCRRCAKMCRECEEDCQKALEQLPAA